MNLQLSLKKNWYDLTKSGIKTEDYREITTYWIKRLVMFSKDDMTAEGFHNYIFRHKEQQYYSDNFQFKSFSQNTMTLGYPKSGDTERILKLEHKGIEIRTGNPDWGAEPNKLYFVIKHGEIIT